MLGHAETLLAAMRHLIATESRAAHFLHPEAATGAKASCGSPRIALIVKRREAGTVGLREQNAALRRTEMRAKLVTDQRHEADGRYDRSCGRSVGVFCQYRKLLVEAANRDDHAAARP